jgi:hypothetical protein
MIDANPLPDSIVGASVLAALFLFRAMLYTHAYFSGIVGTLGKRTLSVNAMQMTRPTAMFYGFSFASLLHASRSYSP